MKKISVSIPVRAILATSAFVFAILLLSLNVYSQASTPVKNIILVHGAFADGSGWEAVFKILTAKGYNVIVAQNPNSSLEDDVATVDRALEKLEAPVLLVGHSWGGAVITQAGGSPKVTGLVYVAGFQPEVGESALTLAMSAPPAPENGIMPPDAQGLLYYDKAKFHAGFCADLSADKAAFMYASQIPVSGKGFGTPLTVAAWKTKPSWAIIPTEDKSINPVIERMMYKRSGATVTEIKGASHVVFISHPKEVAAVIEAAAMGSAGK